MTTCKQLPVDGNGKAGAYYPWSQSVRGEMFSYLYHKSYYLGLSQNMGCSKARVFKNFDSNIQQGFSP